MADEKTGDKSVATRVYEIEARPLTANEIRAQVNLIQEVMASVMVNGQHYGTIPGCGDKPTLFKPGAEKLALTFRLAPDPQIQDLSGPDVARFRVLCRIVNINTGKFIGAGVGEASSDEEKYRWRKAVCKEEFEATAVDRRREKFGKSAGGFYKTQQIRTNPADVANTVLKMAKKRSFVDAMLTVTAASDIFAQDIEDADYADPAPETAAPLKEPEATDAVVLINEAQTKALFDLAKKNKVPNDTMKTYLTSVIGVKSAAEIPADKVSLVMGFVDGFTEKAGR